MSTPVSSQPASIAAAQQGRKGLISSRTLIAVALVLLAAVWNFLPDFTIVMLCYIGLYSMVALGLVMLTGVGGMTSFGQAAFVGVGAYATAWVCTSPVAVNALGGMFGAQALPWLGLLLGFVITFVVAWSTRPRLARSLGLGQKPTSSSSTAVVAASMASPAIALPKSSSETLRVSASGLQRA